MEKHSTMVALTAIILTCVSGAKALDIETVTVGNPGNGPSSSFFGYGAVDYTYNIGKYEVTAGQYTGFLNAVATTDTYGLYSTDMSYGYDGTGCRIQRSGSPGSYSYSVASDFANRPVNYVSWGDAARFANWLTNGQLTGAQDLTTTEDGLYYLNGATSREALMAVTRKTGWGYILPTLDEWYKAACHKNDGATDHYFAYPTSSDSIPGRDMTEATNPGNNANYYDAFTTGYLIGSPYYRTEIGEFELSDSPYGTFDQAGNVSEWGETADAYLHRFAPSGAFYQPWHALVSGHEFQEPQYDDYFGIGFRVAMVPEPATVILLALGGLFLARRRR